MQEKYKKVGKKYARKLVMTNQKVCQKSNKQLSENACKRKVKKAMKPEKQ